jgi:hypothetical protein
MLFVSNAFSLNMVTPPCSIKVEEISLNQVKSLLDDPFQSAVGHQSTAEIITKLVGTNVPTNRISLSLIKKDKLIVFQLLQRLEEGKVLTEQELSQLPYKFLLVTVE